MNTPPIPDRKTFTLIAISWWSLWLLVYWLILIYMGFDYQTALIDSGVSIGLQILIGFAIRNTLQNYQPGKDSIFYLFSWVAGLTLVYVLTLKWVLDKIFISHPDYLLFIKNSIPVRFCITLLMVAFMVSLNWIWHYFMQQKESQQRSIDAERLSREAELSKLRQQLQPHFLFNSLNSISALAGNRPEEARKMIQQLSDFLRGTLRKDEQQMLSLDEELKHLQLYLDIEKVRFGHRLNTVIEVQEHLLDLQIPALLLQPIVENAIKFGLYDTIGEISILVNAHQDAGNLVITVKNPFDPITSKPNEGTGFGLSSVNRRLYLLFARNDLLYTKTQENNFITSIKIPQII